MINKREEEKRERERKEKLKREKEEENERIRREKEILREKIESVSVSDYYEPPIYHRMNTFDNFNAPTFPVYRREFAGGNGQFTVNVGCNIF